MDRTIHRLTPAPPSSSIAETDVTAAKLCSILTSAVIENVIDDDGHIYATDGLEFPTWIEVDAERKLLCFFTYADIPEDHAHTTEGMRVSINNLNNTLILVQFSLVEDRVYGKYWITFDSSLDPRHFIKMLRRFSSVFSSAVQSLASLDPEPPQ